MNVTKKFKGATVFDCTDGRGFVAVLAGHERACINRIQKGIEESGLAHRFSVGFTWDDGVFAPYFRGRGPLASDTEVILMPPWDKKEALLEFDEWGFYTDCRPIYFL